MKAALDKGEVATLINGEALLQEGLDKLFMLDRIYENGSMEVKRRIIGSMFPEKLTFDGERLRTTRVNAAVALIYKLVEAFSFVRF